MKKLISLEDHNKTLLSYVKTILDTNGIECPVCGKELYDPEPFILASDPPQKRTKCTG